MSAQAAPGGVGAGGEGTVRRDGQPLDLTRTEFELLCEPAADPGRVLSREELLERVWG